MIGLSAEQQTSWNDNGFFIINKFASQDTCQAMLKSVVELSRGAHDGKNLKPGPALPDGKAVIMPERKENADGKNPEDHVAKIFRIHRASPFREFCEQETILDLVEGILGPDLDCFLSQFIFKNPAAMGQPWHQDSYYFPFDKTPQVGIWLAITEATLENGCLHVLPGSHKEPVHKHVPDQRPHAQYGYVEIVDHDMSKSIPVLLQPGNLLVFHSHLMHKSTDNVSKGIRAAMVYHYGQAGTKMNAEVGITDWMPVRRKEKS